jgi:hypothetical protein
MRRGAGCFDVPGVYVGGGGTGEEQRPGPQVGGVEDGACGREALDGVCRVAEIQVAAACLALDFSLVDPVQSVGIVLGAALGAQFRGLAQRTAGRLVLAQLRVPARLTGQEHRVQRGRAGRLGLLAG